MSFYRAMTCENVTITGDKVLNTGVQEITTYEGVIKNVSAGYYALEVGSRILIVKSGKNQSADDKLGDKQGQL